MLYKTSTGQAESKKKEDISPASRPMAGEDRRSSGMISDREDLCGIGRYSFPAENLTY